jgi:putative transposase
MRRRNPLLQGFDPSGFVDLDEGALKGRERTVFRKRKEAIARYARGEVVTRIEQATGVRRSQLYALLKRCLAMNPDGRAFGFRALVRYVRVSDYDRIAAVSTERGGAAGAFSRLLSVHPKLRAWLEEQIRPQHVKLRQVSSDDGSRTRLLGLAHLHGRFLRQCRAEGIGLHEYPFTAKRMAIRSLSSFAKARLLNDFGQAARASGAERLKGMPPAAGIDPMRAADGPLDLVECDGYRLDLRLKIVVRDPLGFEQTFEIERVWLLVVLDVFSRAVLCYHVSLGREYSRYDVIRAIERAIEPHRPMKFTLPGVGYGAAGGFPSEKLPELGYALWNRIGLDDPTAVDNRRRPGRDVGGEPDDRVVPGDGPVLRTVRHQLDALDRSVRWHGELGAGVQVGEHQRVPLPGVEQAQVAVAASEAAAYPMVGGPDFDA